MATSTAPVELVSRSEQEVNSATAEVKASLLPYVLSWLRGSTTGTEPRSRQSSTDPRAAETLQRLLGENRHLSAEFPLS